MQFSPLSELSRFFSQGAMQPFKPHVDAHATHANATLMDAFHCPSDSDNQASHSSSTENDEIERLAAFRALAQSQSTELLTQPLPDTSGNQSQSLPSTEY